MITLGIDTSAVFVSAALCKDGRVLAQRFESGARTHSETLLPMVEEVLQESGLVVGSVNRFAVTCGPGSFTGVRIGVAAVKGMAFVGQRPCAGVSALAAMAVRAQNEEAVPPVLCCAMDARRGQVYAAVFENGRRTMEDTALPVAALAQRLPADKPVWFLGDGAQLCRDTLEKRPNWQLAPENVRYQTGLGAVLAARAEDYRPPALLRAVYLRPSQAERLRLGIE
ncbi:MAG: tRNA (adenosine(37)-N6)-threonylcarbamoyltransferase complex dimerization subunit type 1 TsaB [Oscillospiraceae bacterium]|jgi:tRNA threonylcarbamoyladenosine biosynthesis protein TsaB|nr:tRNA (adenosine(37)-N6)-threonylcarbamoyltransferase complex dimerization subunit type 1 TsaB [Oscillospiraceae bacterium]